jgi:hypothetical protein
MNAVQGELIAAGSTDVTQLVLTDVDKNEQKNFFCQVVSGSVRFGKDGAAATQVVITDDEDIVIRCTNGELYFDAASALDTFYVTVIP